MFTLLGLRLPVVVEIFWKKEVIKKNGLKMIYYSCLHRQGMPLVDQSFAYTAWSTNAEKSMEILTWLTSEKPSMPGLACQYIIILLSETQRCGIEYLRRYKWLLIFQHPLTFLLPAWWIGSILLSTMGQKVCCPPSCCLLGLRKPVVCIS